MKKQITHPDYGPSEYNFDFTFEFKLTFFDYILMGVYVIFVVPVLLLIHLVEISYLKIKDSGQSHRRRPESKKMDHGELSLISKLF